MATSKKSPSTLLKEANKQIEELTKQLKSAEQTKDSYYRQFGEANNELESIHTALDSIGVPSVKKDRWGTETRMNASARLFAWLAGAKAQPATTN